MTFKPVFMATLFALSATQSFAHDFSGSLLFEPRGHFEEGLHNGQDQLNLSGVIEMRYTHTWEQGRQTFDFVPFFRLDQGDKERTHFDVRELSWIKAWDEWELRLGVRKVFWGVTESQHLVDVINQADFVENIDNEDRLGQPMINLAWIQDFGTIDVFILPYFRKRTFPGPEGRFRFLLPVDSDAATFESSREEKHIDFALRWSHTIDNWDIGLSFFSGTQREPELIAGTDSNGNAVLIPNYLQMEQTGVELQYTLDSWLLKFESIFRSSGDDDFAAFTGGFEYSFYGVIGAADLGLLTEHHFDERDERSSSGLQNDLFVGTRWAFNDTQSTELLGGMIFDLESTAKSFFLEARRRLGERWTLAFEIRALFSVPSDDTLFAVRKDSFAQAELEFFF